MSEGIIIPDTESADAEIWVTEIHYPFNVEKEYGTLITVIPFNNYRSFVNDEGRDFHRDVLDVAKSLDKAYQHETERCINIEVRFKNTYCNY